MILSCQNIMSEDEKGKKFLELIDEQNTLQWSILSKLSQLVISNWDSMDIKQELESLIQKHSQITKEINSLDENNDFL